MFLKPIFSVICYLRQGFSWYIGAQVHIRMTSILLQLSQNQNQGLFQIFTNTNNMEENHLYNHTHKDVTPTQLFCSCSDIDALNLCKRKHSIMVYKSLHIISQVSNVVTNILEIPGNNFYSPENISRRPTK
jgi:hypothetical protein